MKKNVTVVNTEPVVLISDDAVSYTIDSTDEFYANAPIGKEEIRAYEEYVNDFTVEKLTEGVNAIKKDLAVGASALVEVKFGSRTATLSHESGDTAITVQSETAANDDKWLLISKLLSNDS